MSAKHYYHFTNGKLRNGDPVPPIGEWIEVAGKITPCVRGLHASEHPFDALTYAPGTHLHLVELDGLIIPHGNPVDKVVAQRRKIVATIHAETLCRDFARRAAIDVLPLWDAPEVVKQYLETGDEKLRDAALDATRDARDACAAAYAAWAAYAAGALLLGLLGLLRGLLGLLLGLRKPPSTANGSRKWWTRSLRR